MFFLVDNKCNRVKGHGIIYTNYVIKKLIYNIKDVRKCMLHKQHSAPSFCPIAFTVGQKGHGIIKANNISK